MEGEIIRWTIFFIRTFGLVFATNLRFDSSEADGFNMRIGIAPKRLAQPRKRNIMDAPPCQPLVLV